MSRRQPADVVVRLDRLRDTVGTARLDHVGVERPLDEAADVAQPASLVLEDADELLADDLPLPLRVGDAGEAREESLLRLDVHERHVEDPVEGLDHLRRLPLAKQAVVDEDAGELVADRLVHEQRRDRGVDPTGESAQHALGADLGADARHLLLDHRGRRPRGHRTREVVEEVLQHLLPVRRVHDLGVELDAVEPADVVLEGRDRRVLRLRDHPRAVGRRDDGVAVRHPRRLLVGERGEQALAGRVQRDLPVLSGARLLDPAAELEREELRSVADAERRDAELEDGRIDPRRPLRVDGGGTTREDQRDRVAVAYLLGGRAVADELGVDAGLAHPSRDQLRVLAAEVDHQHGALLRGCLERRPGHPCGRLRRAHTGERTSGVSPAGNSGRPS